MANRYLTNQFFVPKSTGTSAEALAAVGLADVLDKIIRSNGLRGDITIRDEKGYYKLSLENCLKEEWLKRCRYFSVAPLIVTTDKHGIRKPMSKPPMEFVDYKAEQERVSRYFELLKDPIWVAAKKQGQTEKHADLKRSIEMQSPLPYWEVVRAINQMSAINAHNGMVMAWYEAKEKDCFSQYLEILLTLFSDRSNDVQAAVKQWKRLKKERGLKAKPDASATQLYNPAMGKGANRTKADNLTIGGLNNFWMVELLKIVGLFQVGLPRVVTQAKDRKNYILLPHAVTFSKTKALYKAFNEVMYANTAIKMDILAALRYTTVFLKQWRAGRRRPRRRQSPFSEPTSPSEYISGLGMVFYKDMGNAVAVLNQSTIGIPDWVGDLSGDRGMKRASLFLRLVSEHSRIINDLKENISLDYELLRSYRDFLSSGKLADFFQFTALYSSFLTSKYEKKEPYAPKHFQTNNLEDLIVSKEPTYARIVKDEGFQRIATAIRHSTVLLQYYRFRHESKEKVYDIRYGLGQSLLRKSKHPEQFLSELSKFLVSYSNENAMKQEHAAKQKIKLRPRPPVQVDDIEKLVQLVDEFRDNGGAELICNLLVAYGYASSFGPAKETTNSEPTDASD